MKLPAGKTISIPAHCPTRFGIVMMICKALKDSKEAIRNLLERDDWDDLAGDSLNARSMAASLGTSDFWKKLEWMIQLNEPVREAIHQLEADKPHLSQVWMVWRKLIQHAMSWAEQKGTMGKQVEQLLERRFNKHCKLVMAAAYLVDP